MVVFLVVSRLSIVMLWNVFTSSKQDNNGRRIGLIVHNRLHCLLILISIQPQWVIRSMEEGRLMRLQGLSHDLRLVLQVHGPFLCRVYTYMFFSVGHLNLEFSSVFARDAF
jgi:hypothetical protein